MPLILLLRPLLRPLLPLLKRRDTYYLFAIGVFFALWWCSVTREQACLIELAKPPKVVFQEDTKTVTKVVRGPVRVVERFVKGEVVEKTIFRDPTTFTKGSETHLDGSITPSSLPVRAPKRRYVGLGMDPVERRFPRWRMGLTLWDTLDVGGAYDTRAKSAQAEVALRF